MLPAIWQEEQARSCEHLGKIGISLSDRPGDCSEHVPSQVVGGDALMRIAECENIDKAFEASSHNNYSVGFFCEELQTDLSCLAILVSQHADLLVTLAHDGVVHIDLFSLGLEALGCAQHRHALVRQCSTSVSCALCARRGHSRLAQGPKRGTRS